MIVLVGNPCDIDTFLFNNATHLYTSLTFEIHMAIVVTSIIMYPLFYQVLSQGDEKGFQKSVKILGFQMKITVTLVREYSDYLSESGSDVFKVFIYSQMYSYYSKFIYSFE